MFALWYDFGNNYGNNYVGQDVKHKAFLVALWK